MAAARSIAVRASPAPAKMIRIRPVEHGDLPKVREMYDETFVRMWRFYLVACEATFEEMYQGVFHFQLAHRQYAVPVTRDYLYHGQGDDRMMHAAQ